MKLLNALAIVSLLSLTIPAFAADSPEVEPNDDFPPTTIGTVFQSGDRLTGSITEGDIDQHYLTVAGAGSPGIYRYDFNLATGGGDSFMYLYDGTPAGNFLGVNDDFGSSLSSRLFFDHFDTSGANTTWGVEIGGFSPTETFDYSLAVTRTPVSIASFGNLAGGTTSIAGTTERGRSNWYSFTLGETTSVLTLDTLGAGSGDDDTVMTLFDAQGNPIAANDDAASGELRSAFTLNNVAAGTYYVAAGQFNLRSNLSYATGNLRPWDRNGVGDFSVIPSGPLDFRLSVTAVPEPGAFALLLGMGVCGAGFLRRRK